MPLQSLLSKWLIEQFQFKVLNFKVHDSHSNHAISPTLDASSARDFLMVITANKMNIRMSINLKVRVWTEDDLSSMCSHKILADSFECYLMEMSCTEHLVGSNIDGICKISILTTLL